MSQEIAIHVYQLLPELYKSQVDRLINDCFTSHWQEGEERLTNEDKFCSEYDLFKRVIAIINDEVVGYAGVLRREILFGEKKILLGGLGGVCVRNDKRGLGIARQLVARAMLELQSAQCDIAYLCADGETAIKLYGRVGFVSLKNSHTYLGKSGKRYRDHDGFIAPVCSQEVFQQVLEDTKPFDIGKGNW